MYYGLQHVLRPLNIFIFWGYVFVHFAHLYINIISPIFFFFLQRSSSSLLMEGSCEH